MPGEQSAWNLRRAMEVLADPLNLVGQDFYGPTLRALGQRLVPGGERGRFPWEAQAAPPPPPEALAVAPPRQAPQRTGLSDEELADIMEIEQMIQAGMSGQDPAPFTEDLRRAAWAQEVFDSTRPVSQSPQTVHDWRFGDPAPPPQQFRQAPSQRREVDSQRRQRELEEEIVALLTAQGEPQAMSRPPSRWEMAYQDQIPRPSPEEVRAALDQMREEEWVNQQYDQIPVENPIIPGSARHEDHMRRFEEWKSLRGRP